MDDLSVIRYRNEFSLRGYDEFAATSSTRLVSPSANRVWRTITMDHLDLVQGLVDIVAKNIDLNPQQDDGE